LESRIDLLAREVNERILAATTRGLERLGKSVSHVTFWKFQQDTGIEPDKISTNSEAFSACMKKLFGPGYRVVENTIARELVEEFRLQNVRTNDYGILVAEIKKDALKRLI
jgi:hypothetical protein